MVLFLCREGLPRPPPLLAQPNLPFGYPVHGVEVMPLHTVPIPGRYISVQKRPKQPSYSFLSKRRKQKGTVIHWVPAVYPAQ